MVISLLVFWPFCTRACFFCLFVFHAIFDFFFFVNFVVACAEIQSCANISVYFWNFDRRLTVFLLFSLVYGQCFCCS